MNIDPNKEDFSGEEEIQADVSKSTPTLVIHSKNLNITNVEIHQGQGDSL